MINYFTKNMSELLGIIQLLVWVVTVAGFYFKMRNDINIASQTARTDNEATCVSLKLTNRRVDKIENDRDLKWREYHSDQKEQNNKLNEIVVGVASIKKDVCWIKNKK